jgi:hypothetical protein
MSWTVFDEKLPVLLCQYSFGPGTANALAVGIEGGLAVVSPPYRASESMFTELAPHGPVTALVASNAFHYMGMAEWKARFPGARLFAPAQSIPRVQRKSGLTPILPLSQMKPGRNVEFVDMPHYKTGEVLVKMTTGRGRAWYVTDVVLNFDRVPGPLIARAVFRLSRSAPGLRFNNVAPLFMVQDKQALKRWLAAEAKLDPPACLLPAHGSLVECAQSGETLQGLFA